MNQIANLIIAVILALSIGQFSKSQFTAFKKEVITKVDRGLPPLTVFTQKLK